MDDITPKNKMDRIDKLDRELYDPAKEHAQRDRRKIHGRDIELTHDFEDEEYDELIKKRPKYNLPTSLFKKVFFAVLTFFVMTLVIAGISLYEGKKTVSEDLIAMEILGQPFIDGGEELELQVRVQNFNEQELQLPDLVLSYPKDSAVDSERVFLRRSLENVGPKERVTEEFDLTLFGQEGDIRTIDATLEYRIDGSSSIFIKEIAHDVIIRSTPTQVLVDAPKTIVRGQEINFAVDISSNSNNQINDTTLRINYPKGFEFIRSNISPNFNNNTWYFSNISDQTERIEVTGRLAALEGQGQSFVVEYGKQNQLNKNQIETVFNGVTHTVEVQKSFIDTTIAVNGDTDVKSTLRGGADINVLVRYENTLSDVLENAIITIDLEGELYDPSRISIQNGFYNSSNNTIVFDQTTSNALKLLQPGQKGEFRFNLFSKELVGASGILTNPKLTLSVNVEGTEINGNNRQALNVASHTVSANSDIAVIPKTLHYDGPFSNSGFMPPRVNNETTYTIVFQITNSSNDISDAELTTFLPSHVEWLNTIAPSVERNNVSYDTTTRKLTWELGSLKAGLGVGTSQPRQLSAQVRVTPSAAQVGSALDMTQDIILTGIDDFTETTLNFKKTPLTNRLPDINAPGGNGRVVN